MKKGLFLTLAFTLLSASLPAWSEETNQRLADEVAETVKKSQEWRKNEVGTQQPQRDLASLTKEEEKLHQEFETLMAKDDDQSWFEKVDSLMK